MSNQTTASTDQSGQSTTPDNSTQATSPAAPDSSAAKPLDDSAGSTIPPTDTSNSQKASGQPLALGPTGGSGGDPHSDDQRKAIGTEAFFQPDPLAGALNYSYPLTLPPGRNNLTPGLSLNYSSQPGANVNAFGYGWSVSIPSIIRINRTGVDAMYGQDYYYSSIDGELASSSPGVYGPIADTGSFNKYVFSTSTNSWTVTDKFGTVYTFGSTTSSRLDNPGNSNQIYQWMLDKVTDTNSNYIKYAYYKDSGEIYPSQVVYTGNGTTDGPFEVDFLRTARSDADSSAQPGFEIQSNYLINEVDVKVSGAWVRKYLLGFTTGDNQTRSLLNSITEEGQDDVGGTITLPPVTFTYQQSNPGWTATSTWNAPAFFTDYQSASGGDVGVRIADVNGDGLPDIVQSYRNGDGSATSSAVYLNTGNGWVATTTWSLPAYFADYSTQTVGDTGVRIADVNGDGLPDIIQSYENSDGSSTSTKAWINTGNGWVASSTWNPPTYFANYSRIARGDVGTRLMDVNGDGLPDIVQSYRNGDGSATSSAVYLNTGNGWVATTTWSVPVYFADYSSQTVGDVGVRVADVNGDGLPDIVQGYTNAAGNQTLAAWINNGHGWTQDNSYAPPTSFVNYNLTSGDMGVRIVDVNGDGLPDIVQSMRAGGGSYTQVNTWINNGHGWTSTSSWNVPLYIIDYEQYGDTGVRDLDVDGNNMSDLAQSIRFPSGAGSTVTTYANNSKKVDLLTQINNTTGGETTYTYKQSPLYTSGSSRLNSHLPIVLDTVNTVTSDDGLGTKATKTYAYSGGTFYYASPIDHKLAGFNKVTATDNAGNYTNTYYHTGNGTDNAHGEYQDSKWKIGEVYRTENYDPFNNLYAKRITRWGQIALGNNRFFVAASSTLSAQYDGSASHRDKAEAYTYDPTYGNLVQKTNYGEVSGNDDGTFTDMGSDLASTSITYAANTGAYIVGLPADELTQDQSSNKVRETRHYYDGLSLGSVNIGNETKTERWITGSTFASTTNVYDGTYGLVTQSRDADGNLTTNTYDPNNLYVATSTNALNQATGYTYDYVTGKVKNTFDPNSRLFVTTYDALRRPLTVSEPDPSTGSLVTKSAYTYTDSNTPGATSFQETDYLSTATSTNTYTYLDGLGRNLQQRKTAGGTNTYAVTDWTYNNLGLLNSESLPYFASSTARSTATSTGALFTTYSYDPLLRISKITNAVGSTTNTYNQWTTTTIDADGHEKDYTKDAYGNLATVVEHTATSTYTTSYAWDRNNNLTSISDASGNVRNFSYDGLGRRLAAQDLHASGDATFGSWSYVYDPADNLTQQTDPKNQVVNYTYDALNRPLTEDYTGQAGTELANTYDSCTNGKGRLCVASSTNALISYAYDPLGLQKGATTTIVGTSTAFATQFDYDRQGNQTFITYPDNAQVQYNYNGAGLLDSVQEKENGGTFTNIIGNVGYSPLGTPSSITYGNGVVTTNAYNPTALYRLTNKVTALPGGSHAQDFTYTYDPVGNITQIVDNSTSGTGKTVNYTYDNLSRLLSATATNASTSPNYAYVYTYDALGNILTGPSGTYSYLGNAGSNYADPDAVTAIATTTFSGGSSVSTSTIALDATSTSYTIGLNGTTTTTWTHTVTGSNPVIVLTADLQQDVAGAGSIGSVSWNGAAFIKATSTRTNNMESEIWYLVASTTGAKTMSVTINGSTDAIRLGASSFTGVSPTWAVDVVKVSNGSGGNPSISITPTTNTDVVIATLSKSGGGGGGGSSTSTPALVQSTVAHGATSVSFASPVTSGNLVVVGITAYGQTLAANNFTDNKGNTYTKAVESINGSDHAAIYYAKNVTGGSSFQVSSIADGTIAIHEYSGVASSTIPLDKTISSTGTSNAPSSGSVTTATSSELYFGLAWSQGQGDTWTAGSGYTLRQTETDNNTYERLATEDAVIASASTTAARFTTSTSNLWAAALATFQPALGGSSGSTSADATSSQTTLYKNAATSTFGGASYKIATSSGSITDTYTTAASQDWALAAIALRPATSTSSGGGTTATTTYAYDNNGNLTNQGTTTYTWDYRNRLMQSGTGLATSTYAYDHNDNRIKLTEAGVTTFFPNKFFSISNASSTKHVFAGDLLLATIESAASSSSTGGGGGGGTSTSTPTYVQSKMDSADGYVTFANPITSGNLIVVGLTIYGTAIPSNAVTDNKGNTYTKVAEAINSGTSDHAAIFYAKNVTGGSSFTITSSIGGTLAAHEYSGVSTSTPFDKAASSTGTSATPTSGNVTTAIGNELYVGITWSEGTAAATAGPNFTLREQETNNSSAERIATEDSVIGTATTTAATFSIPSNPWAAAIATFKPQVMSTSTGGGTGTTTTTTTLRFMHPDYLGSVGVVTNASGTVAETLDYYPYGGLRIDAKTNYGGVRNKYAGTVYDALSGLNYMQARYYDSARGQFVNEDPVFWEVGLTKDGKAALAMPQAQNSYAYANGNPVVYANSTGRFILPIIAAVGLAAIATPYALMVHGIVTHNMDTNALGLNLLGPAQGISGGMVETTGGTNPITNAKFEPLVKDTDAEPVPSVVLYNAFGDSFEQQQFVAKQKEYPDLQRQVTVETPSGVRTRIDLIGRNSQGTVCLMECKSTKSAPFTPNQIAAYPEIATKGATVVGKGKPGFPGGTILPASTVQIIRPAN